MNNESTIPLKLEAGDEIRVIAPAQSLANFSDDVVTMATKRWEEELGCRVSLSKHAKEIDDLKSSSVQSRVEDLHDAFSDKNVKGIIAISGGFNSNQLLKYIDYDLIKSNPKIFCGYSDITALANAVYAKTGLITYSGPNFSTFGMYKGFDYIMQHVKKCLFDEHPYTIEPSKEWSNDKWYKDQENRNFEKNEGYWVINEGQAEGVIIGGNQCTFNLLQGTEYMPGIKESVLFLEDDDEAHIATVDRDLQSIIHQPGFEGVKGIVFGRFQPTMKISCDLLTKIVRSKKELQNLPIVGNVDFGHTMPMITYPIGGIVKLDVSLGKVMLQIIQH